MRLARSWELLNSRHDENFVFSCAAVLLMDGSGVTSLPDGKRLDVLVAGNNDKKNKDNNAVQRKTLG